jgi:hypothetical protein
MLPLAGEELAYRSGTDSSLIISALITIVEIAAQDMKGFTTRMERIGGTVLRT